MREKDSSLTITFEKSRYSLTSDQWISLAQEFFAVVRETALAGGGEDDEIIVEFSRSEPFIIKFGTQEKCSSRQNMSGLLTATKCFLLDNKD